ncbi:MAG: methionyl-tRNA formyltransferase [Haloarculaceae archaeon]
MAREDLNIGYLGYSDVTKEILDGLSLDPELVISFVDSVEAEYGRGVTYDEYDPWIRVASINSPRAVDALAAHDIDVLLVMGWPELLHEEALSVPTVGSLGRHLSLLPERRGRAPVAWALIHGLDRTGVSLFWLDEGIDSGPIVGQRVVEIDRDDHARDLHEKCTRASIDLLSEEVLPRFYEGGTAGEEQNHEEATYTHPRRPDMGIIDWTDSAVAVHNFVRGQSHPYPGAFTYHEMTKVTAWYSRIEDETVTRAAPGVVLRTGDDPDEIVVQCGEGTVGLTVEAAEGGEPPGPGDRLGAVPY